MDTEEDHNDRELEREVLRYGGTGGGVIPGFRSGIKAVTK